eukprot:7784393-Pyramimonas_sp.AAC.1
MHSAFLSQMGMRWGKLSLAPITKLSDWSALLTKRQVEVLEYGQAAHKPDETGPKENDSASID